MRPEYHRLAGYETGEQLGDSRTVLIVQRAYCVVFS